ncbi:hypothetical protein F441_00450, partial [Phytophthora nicotianae CJ01A1]
HGSAPTVTALQHHIDNLNETPELIRHPDNPVEQHAQNEVEQHPPLFPHAHWSLNGFTFPK